MTSTRSKTREKSTEKKQNESDENLEVDKSNDEEEKKKETENKLDNKNENETDRSADNFKDSPEFQCEVKLKDIENVDNTNGEKEEEKVEKQKYENKNEKVDEKPLIKEDEKVSDEEKNTDDIEINEEKNIDEEIDDIKEKVDENKIINGIEEKNIFSEIFSDEHNPLGGDAEEFIKKRDEEKMEEENNSEENLDPLVFDSTETNIYLIDKEKSRSKKEVRRMVCECQFEPDDPFFVGCDENCLNRLLMIECNSRCPTKEFCTNKSFQMGCQYELVIFKAGKKGWGLKTQEPITKGSFVIEYCGEVVDYSEFHRRTQLYNAEGMSHFYFMTLKTNEIIDATKKGSKSRFINHSCDPNCVTQKWTVNGFLRVGFFALRHIDAGEELSFDYQFQRYGAKPQTCYCGSENCRGVIGVEQEGPVPNYIEKLIAPASPSTAKSKKRKNQIKEFYDSELAGELNELLGNNTWLLRDETQVLEFSRLMVQVETVHERRELLKILQATKDNSALRTFVRYKGLSLLWSWMVDAPRSKYRYKLDILKTLKMMPIPNKNELENSKVLEIVSKWSTRAPSSSAATKEDEDQSPGGSDTELKIDETTSESPSNEASDSNQAGAEKKSAEEGEICDDDNGRKSKKKSKKKATDENEKQLELSNAALALLEEWKSLKEVFRIPKKQVNTPQVNEPQTEASTSVESETTSRTTTTKPSAVVVTTATTTSCVVSSTKEADSTSVSPKHRDNDDRPRGNRREWRKSPDSKNADSTRGKCDSTNSRSERQDSPKRVNSRRSSCDADDRWSNNRNNSRGHNRSWSNNDRCYDNNRRGGSSRWNNDRWQDRRSEGRWQNDDKRKDRWNDREEDSRRPSSNDRWQDAEDSCNKPPSNDNQWQRDDCNPWQQDNINWQNMPMNHQQQQQPLPQQFPAPPQPIGYHSHTIPRGMMPTGPTTPLAPPPLPPPIFPPVAPGTSPMMPPTASHLPHASPIVPPTYPGVATPGLSSTYSNSPVSQDVTALNVVNQIQMLLNAERLKGSSATASPTKERVKSPPSSPPRSSPRSSLVLPPNWKTATDGDGRVYYYHTVTRETSWDPPSRSKEKKDSPPPKRHESPPSKKHRKRHSSESSPKHHHHHRPRIAAADTTHHAGPRTPPHPKSKGSKSSSSSSSSKTTSKDLFKQKLTSFVVTCLNSYQKVDCKQGRIKNTDDFKFLARKLTHGLIMKEAHRVKNKHVDLECNESVKTKVKEYIRNYMKKFGPFYVRS